MRPNRTTILILALMAAILLLILGLSITNRSSETPPEPDSPAEPYRILGVWQQRVAVFLPQSEIPERVYDTPVASLPPDVRQQLSEGIAVYDSNTLAGLLEDYLS